MSRVYRGWKATLLMPYRLIVEEIVDYDHSPLQPFCWKPTCYCHEDEDEIAIVYQAVEDGFMTPDEATEFVLGKLL